MQTDQMKVLSPFARIAAFRLAAAVIMVMSGCHRSGDAVREAVPRNPKEAASQLQRVFESAPPDLKRNAEVASEAMRKGDYESAEATSAFRLRSGDRKSTRLNSSHPSISYAVFCLKKKKQNKTNQYKPKNHTLSQMSPPHSSCYTKPTTLYNIYYVRHSL